MKFKVTLILATILTLGLTVFAQKAEPVKPAKLPTVSEILEKYVKALGGRDAMLKLRSRSASGTVELVPMNLKGTFESFAAPETKVFSRLTIEGVGDMLEGSDGKTAWSINPIQGNRDRTGAELLQSQLNNSFYRETKLDKLFSKLELKGTDKVGDRAVYVVSATAEGVPSETWYFDTQTGLMLRSDITAISPEGNQPMTVFYEDLRAVDGVLIPFRIRSQTSQFTIVMTSTEVKHNAAIDETKFAKPKN